MEMLPYADIIIIVYVGLLVLAVSALIGFLWACLTLGVLNFETVTTIKTGKTDAGSDYIAKESHTNIGVITMIIGIIGFLTTMYALFGPYLHFASWLAKITKGM